MKNRLSNTLVTVCLLAIAGYSNAAYPDIYTDIINGLTLNQINCRRYNICYPGDLGYVNYETNATASFTASTVSGEVPLTVTFTNTSRQAYNNYVHNELTYFWDFGDGYTETSKNPMHTYAYGGIYPVKLTITDPRGHTSSYSATITVINQTSTKATLEQVTCIFNWSENNYSKFFPKGNGELFSWPPYTYRYYGSTNYYLAISANDNNLYYMSAADRVLRSAGDIGYWLSLSGC